MNSRTGRTAYVDKKAYDILMTCLCITLNTVNVSFVILIHIFFLYFDVYFIEFVCDLFLFVGHTSNQKINYCEFVHVQNELKSKFFSLLINSIQFFVIDCSSL